MAERIDGFELRRELGRSATGSVHLARRVAPPREVVIKILHADESGEAARARLERERRILLALNSHPDVVTVLGNGLTSDHRPFVVMDYVCGGNLAQRGRLPWQEACEIGVQVASAVAAAHDAGVVHGNLKPQNVLFTELDNPKIADFGTGVQVDGAARTKATSLAYAAPEVLDGSPATVRSDVYGVAATTVGAILGRAPFARAMDSTARVVRRVMNSPVPDLVDRGVPAEVCAVLRRAMAKDPSDRQADVAFFGRDLAAAASAAAVASFEPAAPAHLHSVGRSDADLFMPLWQIDPPRIAPGAPTIVESRSLPRRPLLVAAVLALLIGSTVAIANRDDSQDVRITAASEDGRGSTTLDDSATTIPGDDATGSSDPSDTATGGGPGGDGAGDPEGTAGTEGSASPDGPGTTPAVVGEGPAPTAGPPDTRIPGPGGTTGGGAATPTSSPSSPATTKAGGATPTTAPRPTTTPPAPVNQPPLLPERTFQFRVPINTSTTLTPDTDKRFSASMSDPDGTAGRLCLEAIPQSDDFTMSGMGCDGGGLTVQASTTGTRTIELRAMECSPGCGAPYSTTRRTVRIEFTAR